MQTITVREANQHFSRYIRAVSQGQEFLVTKRGREVARTLAVRCVVSCRAVCLN